MRSRNATKVENWYEYGSVRLVVNSPRGGNIVFLERDHIGISSLSSVLGLNFCPTKFGFQFLSSKISVIIWIKFMRTSKPNIRIPVLLLILESRYHSSSSNRHLRRKKHTYVRYDLPRFQNKLQNDIQEHRSHTVVEAWDVSPYISHPDSPQ